MYRSQRGVTLVELILVVALTSIFTLLAFYQKQADLEISMARQVGGVLYQYNNAVRSAIAQGLVTSSSTKLGTDWLKNTSCGGPLEVDSELLPCDFPSATTVDPIRFGKISLATSIVVSGTAPNRKFTSTTSTTPFTLSGANGTTAVRSDLAGVATMAAAAALSSGFQSSSAGLVPYTATTDSSYRSDPVTGQITMVASNSASNDVWLRTDGGNKMHASLAFDAVDPNDRGILGASSIQNFTGQVLKVGQGSGMAAATSSGVIVDSSAEILGDFRVRKALVVDAGASVTGNVNATGAVIAGGNVTAGGSVSAQRYYDSNDSTYYLDPASASNLNSLTANYLASSGRARVGEYLEVGGIALEGAGCSPNGLVGRDATGLLLSCQSGQWKSSSATAVLTGSIVNGQQIPLPPGKVQSQCTFSVASASNSHPAPRPDYAGGNYATVDSDRIVTCGFRDKGEVIIGGACSYVIACN